MKTISDATRKKMSESAILRHTKFGSGMAGKIHSVETRCRMSKAHRGNKYCLGRKMTTKNIQVLRECNLGNTYFKGKRHSIVTKIMMSDKRKDLLSRHPELAPNHILTVADRCKSIDVRRGKSLSIEHREKLSRLLRCLYREGRYKPRKGKIHSLLTRRKMRISALSRCLEEGFLALGINETSLLDKQEIIDSVVISRQYPLTELGYVVDGYCPETNTVYEVYEKHHDKQVQQDLQRETEICNHLSCDFQIIYDITH